MLPVKEQDVVKNYRWGEAHSYVSDHAGYDSVFLFYEVKTSGNWEEICHHANSVSPRHNLAQYYKMHKSIINVQQKFIVILFISFLEEYSPEPFLKNRVHEGHEQSKQEKVHSLVLNRKCYYHQKIKSKFVH